MCMDTAITPVLTHSTFITMTKQIKSILAGLFLLQLSTLAIAQSGNSWGFGSPSYTLTGWWKIQANIPVYLFGTKAYDAPLWGYVGYLENNKAETWQVGIDGTQCKGDRVEFNWWPINKGYSWSNTKGQSGYSEVIWIDNNNFKIHDASKNYDIFFSRAINEYDAKCNWFDQISRQNCAGYISPYGDGKVRGGNSCGNCSNGCHECSACSGTGRVWNSQDGKWYKCDAYGCGVIAPKGKICN